MSDKPRLVALREYQEQSPLPRIIGAFNALIALVMMAIGALVALWLGFMLMMSPALSSSVQQMQDQAEHTAKVADYTIQISLAVDEEERKLVQEELDREIEDFAEKQRLAAPRPNTLRALGEQLGSVTMIPFLIFTTGAFFLLCGLLFLASTALYLRYRWSRKFFLAVCLGIMLWCLISVIGLIGFYNPILVQLISTGTGFGAMDPMGFQQMQELNREYQQRNLMAAELFGGVFCLFYFGLMGFLVFHREVREDIEREIPIDKMDWEHLKAPGRGKGETNET